MQQIPQNTVEDMHSMNQTHKLSILFLHLVCILKDEQILEYLQRMTCYPMHVPFSLNRLLFVKCSYTEEKKATFSLSIQL